MGLRPPRADGSRGHGPSPCRRRAVAVLVDRGDPLTGGHALDQLATDLGAAGQAEEGLETIQRAFAAVGMTGDERELGLLHVHRAALYGLLLRFGRHSPNLRQPIE